MMCRFCAGLVLLAGLGLAGTAQDPVESLPAPLFHSHSFELLANSRYSVLAGFSDSLPRQVLANVLWAMERTLDAGRGAQDGGRRLPEPVLYAATRCGVYRYDADRHGLVLHRAGDVRYSSGSAFEVGVAAASVTEAGAAVQAGLLAATAFRTRPGDGPMPGADVASCPMKWAADNANASWRPAARIQMVIVLGAAEARPLDTLCAVPRGDTGLPRPYVVGSDSFESVVSGLGAGAEFLPQPLSLETVTQLLWAAYGATPHLTPAGGQGRTVPTGFAAESPGLGLLVAGEQGVDRYLGLGGATGRRLARVRAGDARLLLRSALARVPNQAPLYFVVTVADTTDRQALLEAGCAGFQLAAQTAALGLGGQPVTDLSRSERAAVAAALGLEAEVPVLVFACGEANRTPESLADDPGPVRIVRADPAIRHGAMSLEYLVERSGPVRVEVFDMLGRSVRVLLDEYQSAGLHRASWDGTGADGRRLKLGTYLVAVFARGGVARHKVSLG